jgi:hypothetical protein
MNMQKLLSRHKRPTALAYVTRIARTVAVVLAAFGTTSCTGHKETTVVRGELDRTEWTLRNCETDEKTRIVMSSNTDFEFGKTEDGLKLGQSEAVVVELEVILIPQSSSGEKTLGVMRVISVKRGNCKVSSREHR